MSKSPARIHDEVDSSAYGDGKIVTGNSYVTFENKPVACAGDMVQFEEMASPILEGKACVMVRYTRIALIGDITDGLGIIVSGCDTIKVDEGDPFVFIGDNVSVVKNVSFNTSSNKVTTADNERYTYYLVNSIGGKTELATFDWLQLLDDIFDTDIDEYFEDERWDAEANEGGISTAGRPMAACLGLLGILITLFSKASLRHQLLTWIKLIHPTIKSQIPSNSGLLLEAQYQVYDNEVFSAILYDINIIGIYKAPDYQSEIRKIMTGPALVPEPRTGYEWKYIFIWVTKNE